MDEAFDKRPSNRTWRQQVDPKAGAAVTKRQKVAEVVALGSEQDGVRWGCVV